MQDFFTTVVVEDSHLIFLWPFDLVALDEHGQGGKEVYVKDSFTGKEKTYSLDRTWPVAFCHPLQKVTHTPLQIVLVYKCIVKR